MAEWFEVWSGTLDAGLYEAEVFWNGEAGGMLLVYNTETRILLHGVPVPIEHRPLFGADDEDIKLWQALVTEAVDHPETRIILPEARALADA